MTITVVGAGIAGAACAAALRASGVAVRVVDRGRAPGGRLASPELHGRRVDLGAGYFTVSDAAFGAQVERWRASGLVHPWTDTFTVLGAERSQTRGPMRWGTPDGLRSLVRDLLADAAIDVEAAVDLATLPPGPVVVAMPDPQAQRLVDVPDAVAYRPVIAVAAGFAERTWDLTGAAFVNGHPDITFVADDGARRGDAAPVLVAHTTGERATVHLDDPAGAVDLVVRSLADLLGTGKPEWTHAHRWTFAQPEAPHDAPFAVLKRDGRLVGLAGDQWCPQGKPRVESAWLSGTRLATALLAESG